MITGCRTHVIALSRDPPPLSPPLHPQCLADVDLGVNPLSDASCRPLALLVRCCPALGSLRLRACGFGSGFGTQCRLWLGHELRGERGDGRAGGGGGGIWGRRREAMGGFGDAMGASWGRCGGNMGHDSLHGNTVRAFGDRMGTLWGHHGGIWGLDVGIWGPYGDSMGALWDVTAHIRTRWGRCGDSMGTL